MITPPNSNDIIAIIAEEARIDIGRLKPSATLASLDIASLDVVSVLFAVEDKFGVDIAVEDVSACQTLGQFVDTIVAKIGAA